MTAPTDPRRPGSGVTRRAVLGTTGAVAAVAPMISSAATAAPAAPEAPGVPIPVRLKVNGDRVALQVDPRVTLLDALRERLGLTGTKKGCDRGQCGACTVLVDERRVLSCLTLVAAAEGSDVTTVEGLAGAFRLHPVQQAFIDQDGFQCGFCTSGQIMSAVGVLEEGRAETDDEVREAMSGNICRCSAYPGIVAAVQQARKAMR